MSAARRPAVLVGLVLLVLVVVAAVFLDRAPAAPAGASSAVTTTSQTAPAQKNTAARAAPSPGCVVGAGPVPGAAESHLTVRALCALPAEAARTYSLVRAGGPYPYSRDGIVFANAERLLPAHARGYYHEFTVPTPGEGDRGARRLITGDAQELYYTGDHYGSFVVVDASAAGR